MRLLFRRPLGKRLSSLAVLVLAMPERQSARAGVLVIRPGSRPGWSVGTVQVVSALRFNVVFEDAGEGWVYAHVPELPEVHTQGEGLEQARAMVLDAITMVLDERRARGEPIPEPGWALVESIEIAA